jgi:hypothetical protein
MLHHITLHCITLHAGEVKGLKAQCNSLADAAQAEKFELLAAKQENDRLNDQIVQVRELLYAQHMNCDLALHIACGWASALVLQMQHSANCTCCQCLFALCVLPVAPNSLG